MSLSAGFKKTLSAVLIAASAVPNLAFASWTLLPPHPQTGYFTLIAPIKGKGAFAIIINPTGKTFDFAYAVDDKQGTVYHGDSVNELIAFDNGAVACAFVIFNDELTLQQLYEFFRDENDISFFNGKERFDDLTPESTGDFEKVLENAGTFTYKAE